MRIFVSHGIIFLYDTSEKAPGNDWTEQHQEQGFARRASAINVSTLVENAWARLSQGASDEMSGCERIVSCSLFSTSGTVGFSSVDPGGPVIWRGHPGWVRITLGQSYSHEGEELEFVYFAEEAVAEEPTRIFKDGAWASGAFIETADAARY